MRSRVVLTVGVMLVCTMYVQAQVKPSPEDFVPLRNAYLAKYRPLFLEARQAEWDASRSGTDADYARVRAVNKRLVDLHSDPAVFLRLRQLKDAGGLGDRVLNRELDVMFRAFLPGQADPELRKRIVDLEADVDQIFNTHRSAVGGKTLTENEVRAVLADTTDSAAAEAAWRGYMEVGGKAAPKLLQLVRLRNELARQLGYAHYFNMQMALQEIDETELFRLFDELDQLTREPYARLKQDLDAARAARFRVPVEQLRPWHYGDLFFQEAPRGEDVDLDALFAKADLVALAKRYFASLDLPVDDILARSDLFEKPGKSPHAYCTDMDRAGDVRVLANLAPNVYWADTILHELGHGVYDKYIGDDVPFLLHEASHAITTEGIALLFGAMVKNEDWQQRVLGVEPAKVAEIGRAVRAALRAERLIFARWSQVMLHFEHGLYRDPDQDLARLWWDLKRRYQLQNPPDALDRPDFAAKTHILSTPVYYHNYLMGELFAAQVRAYVTSQVLATDGPAHPCFYEQPAVGRYLRERVFAPGNLYPWNELIRRATGEPLTARYFAADLQE